MTNNVSFLPASRLRVLKKAENRIYIYITSTASLQDDQFPLTRQNNNGPEQHCQNDCLGCSDNSGQATIICYKTKCSAFLNTWQL